MCKIKDLYEMMDIDGSGEVGYDEFVKFAHDPEMKGFAASLELEPNDLQQFFSILTGNGIRKVDLETFVVGCIKLRGTATSMDMQDCLMTIRQIVKDQKQLQKYMTTQFQK